MKYTATTKIYPLSRHDVLPIYRAPRAFDGERFLDGGALVLVEGGTIAGVEPATAPAPEGCAVTDVPDGTLLPGLVDTHVHLCGDGGPRALAQVPELRAEERRV